MTKSLVLATVLGLFTASIFAQDAITPVGAGPIASAPMKKKEHVVKSKKAKAKAAAASAASDAK